MATDINYWWIVPLALIVLLLIIWIIKRDRKDEKDFEKTIIESEMKPEKHHDDIDKEVKP